MNKFRKHVFIIPEDGVDGQIANGFVDHHRVEISRVKVMPPAGGWPRVLKTFREEYVPWLRNFPDAHVIMLIDFDGQVEKRKADFELEIPEQFKSRVFVIGSKHTPEKLKNELQQSFEQIGTSLADDCDGDTIVFWGHEQLSHNDADRLRLVQVVKPFLFKESK